MSAPYRDETETLRARIRALEEENATLAKRLVPPKPTPARESMPLNSEDAIGLKVIAVGTLALAGGGAVGVVTYLTTGMEWVAGCLTPVVILGVIGLYAARRLWQARP